MYDNPLYEHIAKDINLTDEEIALLCSKIRRKEYSKNEQVLKQGEVCSEVNFVVSGCLKISHTDRNGDEHIIMFATEDWWVSDLGSFITQTSAKYNIECLETTILSYIKHTDIEQLYLDIPKLERFFRKKIERALVSSQNRIIDGFSLNAKEKYLKFRSLYPKIEQRVPLYMVASYLGITKEFLSKVKSSISLEK